MLNNRHQSIGLKPDSRPRLEGARYKYLTKLLTPTQPFLALQSCTHSHTSSTRLLPSWVSTMGLPQKASAHGSRVGWTPAQRNNKDSMQIVHMTGHARCLRHTPALATKVSASLDHVCGTLCCRLCEKTLAMDSLSDNRKHFCFRV